MGREGGGDITVSKVWLANGANELQTVVAVHKEDLGVSFVQLSRKPRNGIFIVCYGIWQACNLGHNFKQAWHNFIGSCPTGQIMCP